MFHRKAPEKAILGLNVSKDAQRERERESGGGEETADFHNVTQCPLSACESQMAFTRRCELNRHLWMIVFYKLIYLVLKEEV